MWSFLRNDPITIEWSAMEFSSRHAIDESPQWGLGDTDWWDGGSEDPDTIHAPRGVWVGEQHFSTRTVSWSGLLEACSREQLLEEMQALQSARGTTLDVWEVDLGRRAECRKGQVQITALSDRYARYSVMVILDDPLVSSIDAMSVDRSRMVTNLGSVRARPVVTVTAPGARPTVTIGSWTVQAPRALSGSETFTVDCRTGTLYLGTDPVFPVLVDFPSIRPGATAEIATSHGTAIVDGVSAWI